MSETKVGDGSGTASAKSSVPLILYENGLSIVVGVHVPEVSVYVNEKGTKAPMGASK
jgi:hypothetical protein